MGNTQTRLGKAGAAVKAATVGVARAPIRKKGNSQAPSGSGLRLSAEERYMLVARAAYLRAEKRGFVPGNELQDWVEAEKEVQQLTGEA